VDLVAGQKPSEDHKGAEKKGPLTPGIHNAHPVEPSPGKIRRNLGNGKDYIKGVEDLQEELGRNGAKDWFNWDWEDADKRIIGDGETKGTIW